MHWLYALDFFVTLRFQFRDNPDLRKLQSSIHLHLSLWIIPVLYADQHAPPEDIYYKNVLLRMLEVLKKKNFKQVPHLSGSRRVEIHRPFALFPDEQGQRHAVFVGIHYDGQKGEQLVCHNDVLNIRKYLVKLHGFPNENISVLMDDERNRPPTRRHIISELDDLARMSRSSDSVFLHYSSEVEMVTFKYF